MTEHIGRLVDNLKQRHGLVSLENWKSNVSPSFSAVHNNIQLTSLRSQADEVLPTTSDLLETQSLVTGIQLLCVLLEA